MSKATEWDRNAVREMLKAHGVIGLLEIVREAVDEVADPLIEGREAGLCYSALDAIDDAIHEIQNLKKV